MMVAHEKLDKRLLVRILCAFKKRNVILKLLSAGFVLSLTLAPLIASADIFEPFTTANLNPFTRLHGLPVARSANMANKGKWVVGVQTDLANNFTRSTTSTESIQLDGETLRTTLSLRYGLSERWELGVDLPHVRHSGGSLDGFIEKWHGWFGLPNGGREDFPEDRLNYAWSNDPLRAVAINRSASAIGDASIHVGYQFTTQSDRSLAFRAGVKLPTGEADNFTGSGATDIFASLHMSQQTLFGNEHLAAHGSMGLISIGDGDIENSKDWLTFGSATLAWRVHQRVSLKTQLDFNSAGWDSKLKELGDFSTQLTLGGSIALGANTQLDLAVVEDIVTDTAPDVVLHMSLRRTF